MNKFLFLFLSFGIVLSAGCSKDDDDKPCTSTDLKVNIVNTWNVVYDDDGDVSTGKATFKNDGTWSSVPTDLFWDGPGTKTYETDGSQFTIEAGSNFSISLPVTVNECKKVVIHGSFFNTTITLTR